MPLQRFIPSSSDRYISNDKNQGAVKFGHLNAVVDYINSSVIPDGLQLEGDGPLTSTPRYITDNSGNLSSLAISSGNIGIGTNTPTALLDVIRYTTGSVNNNYQMRILNSADGQYPYSVLLLEHNNRTGVGNEGGASISIKDGFANVVRAGIEFDYFYSGSYTNAGGSLRLSNNGEGNVYIATNGTDALRVFKDQGVQIGGISASGLTSTARLLIKGSGSTSATMSLLVQNSSGTDLMWVKDDGITSVKQLSITDNGSSLQISGIGTLDRGNGIRYGYAGGSQIHRFYTYSGTERLTILDDGNVGIGTSSPADKLVVASSGITGARVQSGGDSASYFYVGNDTIPNRLYLSGGENNNGSITTISNGASFIRMRGNYCLITNTAGNPNSTPAILGIKGLGSTSATTSLLVQNSSGNNSLIVTDDRATRFAGACNVTPDTITGGSLFFNVKSGNWPTSIIQGYENGTLGLGSSTGTVVIGSNALYFKGTFFPNVIGSWVPTNQINQYAYQVSANFTNAGAGGTSEASAFQTVVRTGTSIGNVTLNQFAVKNEIANTGGTTINRGFYYAPTLTSTTNTTNIAFQSTSGSVNINTSTINASAILQADSTTQGFLPPRMTTAEKLAIVTPAAGLQVYDSTLNQMSYYNGSSWINF